MQTDCGVVVVVCCRCLQYSMCFCWWLRHWPAPCRSQDTVAMAAMGVDTAVAMVDTVAAMVDMVVAMVVATVATATDAEVEN